MVVDPANGTLYAGQEDIGIWRLRADLTRDAPTGRQGPRVRRPRQLRRDDRGVHPGADPGFGGTHLTADVEGLTLVQEKGGDGLLLASSQGDDTFAAYDREVSDANEYEGGFRVGPASTTLDGSEECDGAAALNSAAGPPLPARPPRRPGRSRRPGDPDRPATSFKFVDLRKVTAAVDD